ncbi:MAG TPA: M48 family metallopeptidase, partial [bacterium]|nr:M48 family metallopeptidase [bacterium]
MSIRVRLRSALRLLAVLACALLAGCATTQSGITRGLILVPKSMEISLGKAVADEVIGEYGLMDDEVIGGYVSDVGTRLTAVCDRRDLNYSFRVLDTPMVNAFACPGGFVFVTRGLLERCDNEAELATVMAHEVGHVCAYHSVKNLQAQLGYAVVASVLYYNSDNPHRDAIADYANIAYQLMQLGYSRGDEYQADQLGLYYAAHAGYDPYQMETFFRKLIEENGETPRLLVWLSTHPATGDRIARIPKVVEALGLGQNAAPDVGEQRYREMVRARLDGNLENPVRDAFQEAMVALRTEDLAAFMALVADDYRAADGETVAGLRVRLERFFARADNLKL